MVSIGCGRCNHTLVYLKCSGHPSYATTRPQCVGMADPCSLWLHHLGDIFCMNLDWCFQLFHQNLTVQSTTNVEIRAAIDFVDHYVHVSAAWSIKASSTLFCAYPKFSAASSTARFMPPGWDQIREDQILLVTANAALCLQVVYYSSTQARDICSIVCIVDMCPGICSLLILCLSLSLYFIIW